MCLQDELGIRLSESDDVDSVRRLCGTRSFDPSADGSYVLLCAAEYGRMRSLRWLGSQPRVCEHACFLDALHTAAVCNNQTDAVRWLCSHPSIGADDLVAALTGWLPRDEPWPEACLQIAREALVTRRRWSNPRAAWFAACAAAARGLSE